MDRNTLIGGSAVILIIVGIALWAGLRPTPAKAPPPGTGASAIANPYVERAAYYTIAANYPTTTPLLGDASEEAVNAMQGFIIETISQFKTDGNFDKLTPEDIKMMGYDKGRQESLQITYLISSSPRTVSYIFTVYADTLGAHPNAYFKTFTFDTKNGTQVTLNTLFASKSDYLGALSGIARAKLPGIIGEEYADTDYIKSGTEPEEENFQNFFIDNSVLDILFSPYQVGPYAIGPQPPPPPLPELASILKNEYKP